MKRIVIAALMMFVAVAAHAGTEKMDLMLHSYVKAPLVGKAMLGKAVSGDAGAERVDVFVKSSDSDTTKVYIDENGGEVRTIVGNIMTAYVPATILKSLSDLPEVEYIEAAKPMTTKMNDARQATKVSQVETTLNLTGTNVVVGVVDESFDYGNADFAGRVEYVAKRVNNSLVQCSKEGIDAGTCTIATGGDDAFHGTHVTGIAAGANATYKGVAPAANIAFYYNAPTDADSSGEDDTSFSTLVLDGVDRIFKLADNLSKASVVNLSLGTSLGAHDGTSLLEQGLDNLVSGKQGRVIVNAAGNEAVNNVIPSLAAFAGGIHAPVSVADGSSVAWRMEVISTQIASLASSAIVDVWLSTASKDACSITVKGYTKPVGATTDSAAVSTTDLPFSADGSTQAGTAGVVSLSVAVDPSDAQNSKPRALVAIQPGSSGSWAGIVGTYVFDVVIRANGGACSGDMWLYPDQTLVHDFWKGVSALTIGNGTTNGNGYSLADGDSNKTTTIPGTANNVITAGSYMQPKPFGQAVTAQWTGDDGLTYDQTDYTNDSGAGATGGTINTTSNFSSLGPTADGRTKPDVTAPGEPIVSTLATDCKTSRSACGLDTQITLGNGAFVKAEGTSMASPHVAGIVALMLQKNTCLTYAEAKAALRSTASQSGAPDNTSGYGMVDALAAVNAVSAPATQCYTGTADATDADLPSTGGSSGCKSSLTPYQGVNSLASIMLLSLLIIGVAVRRFSL